MSTDEKYDLDKVFKALGHMTRRRILRLLAQGPRYPYELSKLLDMNRRVVLKHLEALEDAGLVSHETGASDMGPDRTYYNLTVSFGLSTTILPNSFVIRLSPGQTASLQLGTRSETEPSQAVDVQEIKLLLNELGKVNRKLSEIDEERMKYASKRGQIITRIEDILSDCSLDSGTCRELRSILNPVRRGVPQSADIVVASWSESVREILQLFERFMNQVEDRDRE
ncbi:ArsR family transcriptional regulator [Candidatus Thorarchaeota archaeon]|nr:MAG: ArsR family transcriptional regulator [Candidatus Thorarchaeota archaeon]